MMNDREIVSRIQSLCASGVTRIELKPEVFDRIVWMIADEHCADMFPHLATKFRNQSLLHGEFTCRSVPIVRSQSEDKKINAMMRL